MGNDMKRVGLIFDDQGAVEFRKSLSLTNAELQKNRNEFKLTKSSWDESTKASEKLRDTQNYLSKQYDTSSQKVALLRSELNELETAEKKDEVAITKKKTALIAAESTLGNYKKGLEEVSSKLKSGTADIEDYAKKLQASGDKLKSVGSGMTTHITAPIAATGAAAFAAWMKIDEAYDNIILKTGATGEALSSLQNSFDTVYGSMPVDSMVVSEAIGEVNTRFKLTGKALEDTTSFMIEFAEITGKDVTDATAEAQRIQGNYNLSLDETKNALGLVAKNAQDTGISVDTLLSSVNKNSSVFKEMGLDVFQATNLLAQFESAGLDSDQMLVGLKKAASNYAKEGKSMESGLNDLVSRLQDSATNASATQEVFDIFGAKAGLSFKTAAQEGRINLSDLTNQANDYASVVSNTYEATLDPADKAKVAMNNLNLAGAALGDVIQSALGPMFEWLSSLLQTITAWFNGLDTNMQSLIVVVGAIVAAIGPLLFIIGTLAGSVSNIILLFSNFSVASVGAEAATTGLTGALTGIMAPIAAVIAVVALLVAAVIDLWNNNEGFRTAMENAWNSICSTLQLVWDTIIQPILNKLEEVMISVWENGIQPLWDVWTEFVADISIKMAELWESIKPIVDWFISFFGPMIVGVFNAVSTAIGGAITTVMNILGSWLSGVGDVIGGIIDVIRGIIDFVTGVFTGDWEKAWNGVQDIFSGIFNGLMGIVKAPLNGIIGFLNLVIDALNGLISGLNSISFSVPDWVPVIGGKEFGFDLGYIGKLSYLAKGGNLLSGMAVVAEAGPELLMQQGNRTTVTPLSNGGGAKAVDIFDYEKLAMVFIKSLRSLSINLNGDKVGEFVDDRLIKAVT